LCITRSVLMRTIVVQYPILRFPSKVPDAFRNK